MACRWSAWLIGACCLIAGFSSLGLPVSGVEPPAASSDSGRSHASASSHDSVPPPLRFWHLTDVHLNLWHSARADVRDMCRSAASSAERRPGSFGHFNCDPAPDGLLRLAVARMAEAEPAPSAILLGGDDHGHVPPSRDGASALSASRRAVASALAAAFPSVPVLPALGNHDTWPYFTAGEAAGSAFAELAELYGGHLAPAQRRHLASRGYYCHRLSRRVWVAALETNSFSLPAEEEAASRQLDWLRRTVDAAAAAGASLLVFGHIAPGASHVDWDSMGASGWSGGGWTARAQEQLFALLRREAEREAESSQSPVIALAMRNYCRQSRGA